LQNEPLNNGLKNNIYQVSDIKKGVFLNLLIRQKIIKHIKSIKK